MRAATDRQTAAARTPKDEESQQRPPSSFIINALASVERIALPRSVRLAGYEVHVGHIALRITFYCIFRYIPDSGEGGSHSRRRDLVLVDFSTGCSRARHPIRERFFCSTSPRFDVLRHADTKDGEDFDTPGRIFN